MAQDILKHPHSYVLSVLGGGQLSHPPQRGIAILGGWGVDTSGGGVGTTARPPPARPPPARRPAGWLAGRPEFWIFFEFFFGPQNGLELCPRALGGPGGHFPAILGPWGARFFLGGGAGPLFPLLQ